MGRVRAIRTAYGNPIYLPTDNQHAAQPPPQTTGSCEDFEATMVASLQGDPSANVTLCASLPFYDLFTKWAGRLREGWK